jgi:hypothetical protein
MKNKIIKKFTNQAIEKINIKLGIAKPKLVIKWFGDKRKKVTKINGLVVSYKFYKSGNIDDIKEKKINQDFANNFEFNEQNVSHEEDLMEGTYEIEVKYEDPTESFKDGDTIVCCRERDIQKVGLIFSIKKLNKNKVLKFKIV